MELLPGLDAVHELPAAELVHGAPDPLPVHPRHVHRSELVIEHGPVGQGGAADGDHPPDHGPGLGHHREDAGSRGPGVGPEQGDLVPIALERVGVVVDPLDGQRHVEEAVVTGGVVVARAEEAERTEPEIGSQVFRSSVMTDQRSVLLGPHDLS